MIPSVSFGSQSTVLDPDFLQDWVFSEDTDLLSLNSLGTFNG